jgi:hypothetical protein
MDFSARDAAVNNLPCSGALVLRDGAFGPPQHEGRVCSLVLLSRQSQPILFADRFDAEFGGFGEL